MRSPFFIGARFGRRVLVRAVRIGERKRPAWLTRCDCGTLAVVRTDGLNKYQSCGCFQQERAVIGGRKGGLVKVHGHAVPPSPTYIVWQGMVGRCYYPNNASYARYGGRGISVCKRWRTFTNFLADMGVRPKGRTLDRINSNGNYTPGNCRWATPKQQYRYRRK